MHSRLDPSCEGHVRSQPSGEKSQGQRHEERRGFRTLRKIDIFTAAYGGGGVGEISRIDAKGEADRPRSPGT